MNYYNENNPDAVRWIQYLIAEDLIPDGYVDDRSIRDVQPGDLAGFNQCHFFCGIAGWPRALALAGWSANRPIWTASCPCQGESVAGRRLGKDDPRHLWPDYFRLVRACRPIFQCGEQVARAARTHWLDRVFTDLENTDYAVWATDIPACAVDAPHIRSRIWWIATSRLAHTKEFGSSWWDARTIQRQPKLEQPSIKPERCHGRSVRLEHTQGVGWREGWSESEFRSGRSAAAQPNVSGGGLGDADSAGLAVGRSQRCHDATQCAPTERADGCDGESRSWWADADWLDCHDGKKRRSKSGLSLLVAGLPGRVAAWRGFGNAINPILAAEVIKAYMDIYPDG